MDSWIYTGEWKHLALMHLKSMHTLSRVKLGRSLRKFSRSYWQMPSLWKIESDESLWTICTSRLNTGADSFELDWSSTTSFETISIEQNAWILAGIYFATISGDWVSFIIIWFLPGLSLSSCSLIHYVKHLIRAFEPLPFMNFIIANSKIYSNAEF